MFKLTAGVENPSQFIPSISAETLQVSLPLQAQKKSTAKNLILNVIFYCLTKELL